MEDTLTGGAEITVNTPDFAEIKQEPESWLNKDRESAFSETRDLMNKLLDNDPSGNSMRSFVVDAFNDIYGLTGDETLTAEDVRSLSYAEAYSPSASDIAGTEITRPVFIFSDTSEFNRFFAKTSKHQSVGTTAVYLPLNEFRKKDLGNRDKQNLITSGVILANGEDKGYIGHEVRHSIDPNVSKRVGYSQFISEAFAHYFDYNGKWDSFRQVLKDPVYYTNFLKTESALRDYLKKTGTPLLRLGSDDVSKAHFDRVADRVVDRIIELSAVGSIEAQRKLAQIKSLDELIS